MPPRNLLSELSYDLCPWTRFAAYQPHTSMFNTRKLLLQESSIPSFLLWKQFQESVISRFQGSNLDADLPARSDICSYKNPRRPVVGVVDAGYFCTMMTYPLPDACNISRLMWAAVPPICPMFWWEKSGMFTYVFCSWWLRLVCNINHTRVLSVVPGWSLGRPQPRSEE